MASYPEFRYLVVTVSRMPVFLNSYKVPVPKMVTVIY